MFWNEDETPDEHYATSFQLFRQELSYLASHLDCCMLDASSRDVSVIVAGYIAKKLIEKSCCLHYKLPFAGEECKAFAIDFDYLLKLSHGGLILPAVDLTQFVAKLLAILETAQNIIFHSG